MGRAFVAMSPHRDMGEFDQEAVERMFRFMIDADAGILIIGDGGFIGGVIQPIYFCPKKLMCEEHFWFSIKGGRDLLRAFERKAAELGATFVSMSTLENERSHLASRLVAGMGYQTIERRHLKELK